MCVCVIKLIGWKMDGWIGLSGCGKWMESGCGKWLVARFRISHVSQTLFRAVNVLFDD